MEGGKIIVCLRIEKFVKLQTYIRSDTYYVDQFDSPSSHVDVLVISTIGNSQQDKTFAKLYFTTLYYFLTCISLKTTHMASTRCKCIRKIKTSLT